jgi:hypothetical protein
MTANHIDPAARPPSGRVNQQNVHAAVQRAVTRNLNHQRDAVITRELETLIEAERMTLEQLPDD